MELSERPSRTTSRAWVLATCVAIVPALVTLLLNVDARVLLFVSLVSGLLAAGLLVTWAVYRTRRQRETFERELEAWATERATQEERLRIARELHDLASHGLGMITVHTGATSRRVGSADTAELREALGIIEHLSRETTRELRRMLTLLRTPGEGSAPLRPADDLHQLPDIIAAAGRAGLRTQFESAGLPTLTPGTELAVCAVVREGLANALRHSGPTVAHVRLSHTGETVSVEVRDDGPVPGWRPGPGAGHGLSGLRERLAVHNGSLTAARTGAGYQLRATIPIGGAP